MQELDLFQRLPELDRAGMTQKFAEAYPIFRDFFNDTTQRLFKTAGISIGHPDYFDFDNGFALPILVRHVFTDFDVDHITYSTNYMQCSFAIRADSYFAMVVPVCKHKMPKTLDSGVSQYLQQFISKSAQKLCDKVWEPYFEFLFWLKQNGYDPYRATTNK